LVVAFGVLCGGWGAGAKGLSIGLVVLVIDVGPAAFSAVDCRRAAFFRGEPPAGHVYGMGVLAQLMWTSRDLSRHARLRASFSEA
jgi:hypothetical protein